MADITDQHDQTSPTDLEESQNGSAGAQESRGIKRARPAPADDDDDDDEKGSRERRKIEIKFISDKSRRHITFSKRKAGIMKKVRSPARRRRSPPSMVAPGGPGALAKRDGGGRDLEDLSRDEASFDESSFVSSGI